MTELDEKKWQYSAFNVIITFGFLIRDGKILLIRRANEPFKGMTTVPGGRKERGETTREACAREIREESGYEIGSAEFVGTLQAFTPESEFDFISFYYLSREFSGEMTRSNEGELLWTPIEKSMTMPGIHSYYVAAISRIISGEYPFDGSVRPGPDGRPIFTF